MKRTPYAQCKHCRDSGIQRTKTTLVACRMCTPGSTRQLASEGLDREPFGGGLVAITSLTVAGLLVAAVHLDVDPWAVALGLAGSLAAWLGMRS